jgi:hypothetical protein
MRENTPRWPLKASPTSKAERGVHVFEDGGDTDDDDEQLEETDIESDEERDGDVDAGGASEIPSRNR